MRVSRALIRGRATVDARFLFLLVVWWRPGSIEEGLSWRAVWRSDTGGVFSVQSVSVARPGGLPEWSWDITRARPVSTRVIL